MPTKIILIRHGQTRWNAENRYQGSSDISLNRIGIKQANKVKKALQGKVSVHTVYCSDRKRALQTARIIFGAAPVKKMPALREMDFGVLEGLRYPEIAKKYPRIAARLINVPFLATVPKGESFRDCRKRVIRAFRKIVSREKGKTIAIVTHAGPIRIILNEILKPKSIWDIKVPLGSVHVVGSGLDI